MSILKPNSRDRRSWRTSTAPTAVSVALLTALAVALALGFREAVQLVGSLLGQG